MIEDWDTRVEYVSPDREEISQPRWNLWIRIYVYTIFITSNLLAIFNKAMTSFFVVQKERNPSSEKVSILPRTTAWHSTAPWHARLCHNVLQRGATPLSRHPTWWKRHFCLSHAYRPATFRDGGSASSFDHGSTVVWYQAYSRRRYYSTVYICLCILQRSPEKT